MSNSDGTDPIRQFYVFLMGYCAVIRRVGCIIRRSFVVKYDFLPVIRSRYVKRNPLKRAGPFILLRTIVLSKLLQTIDAYFPALTF